MPDDDYIWRFAPGRTQPDILEEIFVQREALAEDLVERIRDSAQTRNRHHSLLIGPRGIGKTHLVSLVRHRVASDAGLRDRLRIAWLNEDETTASFLDLLLRIHRALSIEHPDEFPADVLDSIYQFGSDEACREAQRLLLERLGNRVLLLIVENLDEQFRGLGDEGQKQWRALLQEHAITTVLATAQRLFGGVSKRTSPFFGFFQIEHLRPLSVGEAVALLLKIACHSGNETLVEYLQAPEGRSRVRALHHLAGGNHRLYIMLAELIDRDSLADLVGPFERMIDELTPYYQERLRWLAPQQRRIVELLCAQTAPRPVKEIARRLFATEQTTASQLKKLREQGYVVSRVRGRESLYELTEPLMRLSFEVKENRREPLRLIVDFLRIWYRPEHLREKLATLAMSSGRPVAHLHAAISATCSDDPCVEAMERDIREAKEQGRVEDGLAALEELAHTRGKSKDWFALACCLHELERYDEVLAATDKSLAIDSRGAHVWSNRATALNALGRHEEAVFSSDQALAIAPHCFYAWHNRGIALNELGRYEEALTSLDKALRTRPRDVETWSVRGYTLHQLGRHEEELASYDRALAIDPKHTSSWNNRGNALNELHRHEEALAALEKALVISPSLAAVWNNRGVALSGLGRHAEALASLDKALAIDPKDGDTWGSRGGALYALGRYDEALANYDRTLADNPHNAFSWSNRGAVLGKLGRREEALTSYDRALAADGSLAGPAFDRVEILFALERWEEGFAGLHTALAEHWPNRWSYAGDVPAILDIIERRTDDPRQCQERIERLIGAYSDVQSLVYLGDGLVSSLARWREASRGREALTSWRRIWLEATRGQPALELPLRIFDAGVRYLMSGDARVLLDLVETERRVLKQALKLNDESNE